MAICENCLKIKKSNLFFSVCLISGTFNAGNLRVQPGQPSHEYDTPLGFRSRTKAQKANTFVKDYLGLEQVQIQSQHTLLGFRTRTNVLKGNTIDKDYIGIKQVHIYFRISK